MQIEGVAACAQDDDARLTFDAICDNNARTAQQLANSAMGTIVTANGGSFVIAALKDRSHRGEASAIAEKVLQCELQLKQRQASQAIARAS